MLAGQLEARVGGALEPWKGSVGGTATVHSGECWLWSLETVTGHCSYFTSER